ncbi:uncharacterized protein LOC120324000 [Pipra filicauda]|uniref:Uncharacterized protein LOC120324000 n=1 Tax=Pipra filicauda TaxID=649802 RepID=A0A7R5KKR6_9PASS|nr:uncharacterized protein LOC120324000 [Pipra filicauda]
MSREGTGRVKHPNSYSDSGSESQPLGPAKRRPAAGSRNTGRCARTPAETARPRVRHDRDFGEGGPSHGEGNIRQPLVRPQEKGHTPPAAVPIAMLKAGGVMGAQGQPRELRAPKARWAQARRLQADLRGRGAPGEDEPRGGRCAVLSCDMRQGVQNAWFWFFFPSVFLLPLPRLLPLSASLRRRTRQSSQTHPASYPSPEHRRESTAVAEATGGSTFAASASAVGTGGHVPTAPKLR